MQMSRRKNLIKAVEPVRKKGKWVLKGWKQLHSKAFHNVYSALHMRVVNSRRMRCALHVERTGRQEMHAEFKSEILH